MSIHLHILHIPVEIPTTFTQIGILLEFDLTNNFIGYLKGHPKMSTFSRVYKTYTFGGRGVCQNQHFFCTLNFLAWFLLFSWRILTLNNCWCVGGRSQKVYGLYTLENVDIYGRPLTCLKAMSEKEVMPNK